MKSDLKSSKILFTKKKKEYSFLDWNVELIQKPSELMQKFKSLDIKNKTITNIRCVGLCYNLREDMLEEDGYNYYETKNNKDFETLSNYSNFLLDTPFSRHAEIDEVIILELDNKERFEIDFSEASSIKIGICINGMAYKQKQN
ncbi:MAG: hypothetical protein PHG03_04910 [Bacilli bacterium]|nr:hypothetical protein [Bacilli bacterium]